MWKAIVFYSAMAIFSIGLHVNAATSTVAKPHLDNVKGEVQASEKREERVATPCIPQADLRTSDLCAQWKAADAARDAATAAVKANTKAQHANIIAAGSGAFSFIAMLGALFSAWYSQRTLHSDRAWMVADGPSLYTRKDKIVSSSTPGDRVALRIEWKNSGRSPAREVRTWEKLVITENNADIPKFTPDFTGEHPCVVGCQESVSGNEILFTDQQMSQMFKGEMTFYLCGAVEYLDIFENKLRRKTFYCTKIYHFIDGIDSADDQKIVSLQFRHNFVGNNSIT